MKLGSDTMASPLAILNAEQYDGIYLGGKMPKTRKTTRPPRDEVPRKRARTSAATATVQEQDEEEEKTKRTRGRPRLDTTDQTAADVSGLLYALLSYYAFQPPSRIVRNLS